MPMHFTQHLPDQMMIAIKFKCLLVTNDEMRDHLFQLLGNDFFPKWKGRHQVRFHFSETGPVYRMPPPCLVVIQVGRGADHYGDEDMDVVREECLGYAATFIFK